MLFSEYYRERKKPEMLPKRIKKTLKKNFFKIQYLIVFKEVFIYL